MSKMITPVPKLNDHLHGQDKFSTYMQRQYAIQPILYDQYIIPSIPIVPINHYPQNYYAPNIGYYVAQTNQFQQFYMNRLMQPNYEHGKFGFQVPTQGQNYAFWGRALSGIDNTTGMRRNENFTWMMEELDYSGLSAPHSWSPAYRDRGEESLNKYQICAKWVCNIPTPSPSDEPCYDVHWELNGILDVGGVFDFSALRDSESPANGFDEAMANIARTYEESARAFAKALSPDASDDDDHECTYWLLDLEMDKDDPQIGVWEEFQMNGIDMGEINEEDLGLYRTPICNLSYSKAVFRYCWK